MSEEQLEDVKYFRSFQASFNADKKILSHTCFRPWPISLLDIPWHSHALLFPHAFSFIWPSRDKEDWRVTFFSLTGIPRRAAGKNRQKVWGGNETRTQGNESLGRRLERGKRMHFDLVRLFLEGLFEESGLVSFLAIVQRSIPRLAWISS